MDIQHLLALLLVPKEVRTKLYEDLLSPSVRQIGELGGGATEMARRLVSAPFKLVSAGIEKYEAMFERIAARVAPDRRLGEALPEVVGPALEHMRFLDDGSELWQMFEEVLTRSIDLEKFATVHPAFVHLIGQLSRDEAWILLYLKTSPIRVVYSVREVPISRKLEILEVKKCDYRGATNIQMQSFHLFQTHLGSIGLIELVALPAAIPISSEVCMEITLSSFGRLFVEATVPEAGFQA